MENIPEFISNHLILATLFIAILTMLIWNIFGAAISGVKQVSTAELTRLINHENAVVVDVRREDDYKAGHILNSINFPTTELESRMQELDEFKEVPLVVYCGHGNDSAKAARILQMNGHNRVFTLSGGFHSWQSGSLPIMKD